MVLKLPLKKKKDDAPQAATTPPTSVPVSEYTEKTFPEREIVYEEGHPRRCKTYSVLWIEVFASADDALVEKARNALYAETMSNYTLLDKKSGERMLMTSESFYADARRAVLGVGLTPWGMDAEQVDES